MSSLPVALETSRPIGRRNEGARTFWYELNPLIRPTRGAEQQLRWRGGGVGRGRAAARIAS
eukprot:6023327-Pleurochrysis_carterae.AAC.1